MRYSENETNNPTGRRSEDRLREHGEAVREDLRNLGTSARDVAQERLSDAYEMGRERANEMARRVESYVRQEPMKSLLIATGIGLVMGLFWSRR